MTRRLPPEVETRPPLTVLSRRRKRIFGTKISNRTVIVNTNIMATLTKYVAVGFEELMMISGIPIGKAWSIAIIIMVTYLLSEYSTFTFLPCQAAAHARTTQAKARKLRQESMTIEIFVRPSSHDPNVLKSSVDPSTSRRIQYMGSAKVHTERKMSVSVSRMQKVGMTSHTVIVTLRKLLELFMSLLIL
mmetsp:Transcript_7169/g.17471  ORF Transcript_7169/g.17471 Transcript_7169/m.17471 type:complete len:189 (+) Transcript_7169:405-971(+)